MNKEPPAPQPHLWDGTPMAAMPYVISKGNDTPDQREHRVYEGMNMSKAENSDLLKRSDKLLDKLLDHNLQFAQQTGAAQIVDDLMGEVRRLSAINAELLEALKLADKTMEEISKEMTVGERYTNAGQYLIDTPAVVRAAIAKAQGEQP